MKNKLAIGGIISLLLVVAFGVTFQVVKANSSLQKVFNIENYFEAEQEELSLGLADSQFVKYSVDVVGSKTATTTVGINTGAGVSTAGGVRASATSTYITEIGNADEVTYTFKALSASTTSHLSFSFEASNDDYCNNTGSAGGNLPLASEINWFDVGDHLNETVHTLTWNNSSSTKTIFWTNPMDGQGRSAHLHHLDFQCVRLGVAGVSTTLWAQISPRNSNY